MDQLKFKLMILSEIYDINNNVIDVFYDTIKKLDNYKLDIKKIILKINDKILIYSYNYYMFLNHIKIVLSNSEDTEEFINLIQDNIIYVIMEGENKFKFIFESKNFINSDYEEIIKIKNIILYNFFDFNFTNELKEKLLNSQPFSSLHDFKIYIRNILMDVISNNYLDIELDSQESKILFNLLTYSLPGKLTKNTNNNKNESIEFYYSLGLIEQVFQYNNTRLALIQYKDVYGKIREFIYYFTLEHELYDYIDAGRFCLVGSTNNNNGMEIKNVFEEMNPDYIDYKKNNKHMIESILDLFYKKEKIIKENVIKFHIKKYLFTKEQEKNELELKEQFEKKVMLKISKLKSKDGTLVLNNVKYYNDRIEYQNQILQVLNGNEHWVYHLLNKICAYKKFNEINFDDVLELFTENVELTNKPGTYNIIIGTIPIRYTISEVLNVKGVKSYKKLLNDIRINNDEIAKCLKQALCFTNIEDYNNFLKNVSLCSLKIHHYLYNGIEIKVNDPINDDRLTLIFSIKRHKNKHYLLSKNKKFLIKDINKLINLKSEKSIINLFEKLIKQNILNDFSLDDVKDLLEYSKESYEKIITEEKKLIENAEKLFNLKLVENIQLKNNIIINKGYIIPGKIRTYCIDAENDNKVYSYPGGTYLCIIDKTNSQIRRNKLVDRIYALHNDNLVINQLYTLTDGLEYEQHDNNQNS